MGSILHKIYTILHTKRIFWKKLVGSFVFKYFPDKWALKIIYHNVFGRPINLKYPKTFNEKLQWLKLYNRNPEYSKMVDKAAAKDYVASIIGSEYIIPTIEVYDSTDSIDFNKLPNQFVLKTTHGGGNVGVVICKEKKSFDTKSAKEKLEKSINTDTYIIGREWPYKNVKPRIIAESYIEDQSGDLRDYKFMCFNGIVKCSFVCTDRNSKDGVCVTFFDRDWNIMPFERDHSRSCIEITKPPHYETMIQLAEKLARDIPFVRVDFYDISSRVYFGELTFFPGGGFEKFQPEEWDYKLGEMIKLPKVYLK